jgi:hypothetical protein
MDEFGSRSKEFFGAQPALCLPLQNLISADHLAGTRGDMDD